MISSSRLLTAKDKYGVNRRQIITYYYKNNYYNSTVKISVSNDNGKYVNLSTANLIDNVQTNNNYYSSSSIPILDKYLDLGTVNFIIRSQNINGLTPTRLTINEIKNTEFTDSVNITGRYTDINGLNLTYTPLKLVINSVEYSVKTDTNGLFNYKYKTDIIGTNNVTVSYPGNKRFEGTQKTVTFKVTPKSTILNMRIM